jgi:hypothetical protein
MSLSNLLGSFRRATGKPARRSQRRAFCPRLEQLEGRLVPASFVWQTPWEVSDLSSSTAFGDLGYAGDEGPASASASAFAESFDSFSISSVFFQRTFEVTGSPTGWKVTLDGHLSGSLTVYGHDGYVSSAGVTARVQIIDGPAGWVTHDLGLSGYFAGSFSEQNLSVWGTQEGVVPDGTYTVIGSLEASAWADSLMVPNYARSQFADPPGLVTTIDAVPWDNHPDVSISDATFVEGNTGAVTGYFTVALSNPSDQTVTVDFALADGSATLADNDYGYLDANHTVTFAPGVTQQTIAVQIYGDRKFEPNETFSVNLNSPTNATIADGQGQGTILDEEPSISINDVAVTEGNTGTQLAAFTLSLSVAYDVPLTVGYATADRTATAGSDYQAAVGTLTIPAGQTSGTITVLVNGDRLPEPNKTYFVNLSNLIYGVIGDGQAVGTIVDDEPRISISDVTKREGRKNTTLFTFTVTLSVAYDQAVTMWFRTVDGTATTTDNDYVAQAGTLTFVPGETSKTITIAVIGDNKMEANETFYLDLFANSGNSLFTKNRGLGTILNDD